MLANFSPDSWSVSRGFIYPELHQKWVLRGIRGYCATSWLVKINQKTNYKYGTSVSCIISLSYFNVSISRVFLISGLYVFRILFSLVKNAIC